VLVVKGVGVGDCFIILDCLMASSRDWDATGGFTLGFVVVAPGLETDSM
jgi:hypothetical protein